MINPLSIALTRPMASGFCLLCCCIPLQAGAGIAKPLHPESAEANSERYVGTWALTDRYNNLINLLIRSDGSSMTVRGQRLPMAAGDKGLSHDELLEQGNWSSWGNGIRSEYPSGWIDAIQLGPSGLVQWSWLPGSSLNQKPANHGKAVKLASPQMGWVGAYRLVPTQPEKSPYTAVLTSNGLAFNDIDHVADGSWKIQDDGHVMIKWTSGWRTLLNSQQPAVGSSFIVHHWKPGVASSSSPSAVRSGEKL